MTQCYHAATRRDAEVIFVPDRSTFGSLTEARIPIPQPLKPAVQRPVGVPGHHAPGGRAARPLRPRRLPAVHGQRRLPARRVRRPLPPARAPLPETPATRASQPATRGDQPARRAAPPAGPAVQPAWGGGGGG